MSRYRYYTTDLLTGNVLSELDLYGVWLQKLLNSSGQGTATLKLGTGVYNDADLLAGSEPTKTCLYCERDDTLIWGGIIWSRTYSSQSRTCELSCQTFESYFGKTVIEQDFVKQNVEQVQILEDLINALQSQDGSDIGLDISRLTLNTNISRTILIPGYEYHFAQEVVDQIVGIDGGIDMTIDVVPGSTVDQPNKVVKIGYPILGNRSSDSSSTYDYPGNIDSYFWPESGANGSTKQVGLGAGNGLAMLRAVFTQAELRAAGYPSWWRVESYKEIQDAQALSARVVADAARYKMPYSVPTFTLSSNEAAGFSDWNNLGVNFSAHIEDVRFPEGKDILSRMVGWELTTGDSDSTESLNLLVEGGDGG